MTGSIASIEVFTARLIVSSQIAWKDAARFQAWATDGFFSVMRGEKTQRIEISKSLTSNIFGFPNGFRQIFVENRTVRKSIVMERKVRNLYL